MALIIATPDNFPQILSGPGLAWAMLDRGRTGYRNKSTLKTEFRRLAKVTDQIYRVIYADCDLCKPPKGLDFTPSFWLYRDGIHIAGFNGRVAPRDFAARVEGCLRHMGVQIQSTRDRLYCDLKHGVQLTVLNTSGHLSLYEVGDFIASALMFFKHQRDVLKADIYMGHPFNRTAKRRRCILGTMELSCGGGNPICAAMWVEALAEAYPCVSTVEQMIESLPVWQAEVKAQDSYLRPIVGLLGTQGGDLMAMAALLDHVRSEGR